MTSRQLLDHSEYDVLPRSAIIAGMSEPIDRTTTDTQRDDRRPVATRQDAAVGVMQAALILGITTDAVRSTLRRGTLEGHKVDGDWMVQL